MNVRPESNVKAFAAVSVLGRSNSAKDFFVSFFAEKDTCDIDFSTDKAYN